MKTFDIKDAPLKVYGAPFWKKEKSLRRLPIEITRKYENLSFFARRCPGVRVRFKTDSQHITVRFELEKAELDAGMSMYACLSANVIEGHTKNGEFLGMVCPEHHFETTAENTFVRDKKLEDITIFLPRNEVVTKFEILIDDDAQIFEPTPYRTEKPVVFYGSSITEGGCCCNIINAYNAILSRHLDFDYINLGFSGSAKGEPEVAEFISTLDMSAFVYDYDHNADIPEDLLKTHEPFFKIIREAHPLLPVIMMTRPKQKYNEDEIRRRDIVKLTYDNAIRNGDKNVYFIDGETFFEGDDSNACSIDGIHPNDLGFSRMAEKIEPILKKLL